MTHVRFERDVTVDGRPFSGGHVVSAADVPAGYLESCLRVGHCVPCDPPPDPEDHKPAHHKPAKK